MSFDALRSNLNQSLIERDAEVECAMLALVAREHFLMVGPPGTAKSMLCSGLTSAVRDATSFEVLLSKFSTPEELFGPISVTGLKEGRYERLTAGYMPEAHFAFVDEIWKASSAILNTLLTLMQERKFDNGGKRHSCPLSLMVAASNEWPVGEGYETLGAAFDRFLIRKPVKPVSTASREDLLFSTLPNVTPQIDLSDVEQAQRDAEAIPMGKAGSDALLEILDDLNANGIKPGDRRCRKSVSVAKAAAYLAGSSTVEPVHLEPLQYVLWEDPQEQPQKCAEIVCKIANPLGAEINGILAEADEMLSAINPKDLNNAETFSSLKKLEQCQKRLNSLNGNGRAAKAREYIKSRLTGIRKQMLGIGE